MVQFAAPAPYSEPAHALRSAAVSVYRSVYARASVCSHRLTDWLSAADSRSVEPAESASGTDRGEEGGYEEGGESGGERE